MEPFTETVIQIIKDIPKGKVTTYGRISFMAGHPKGARQVSRILHTMSRKYNLPWHRVININGFISLPKNNGFYRQKDLLLNEGIEFEKNDQINLKRYLWEPENLYIL